MHDVPLRPRVHLFVCTNRREADPLGPGCGAYGDAVYDVLKACVAEARAFRDVWVTRTGCLGVCPKAGATVAAYPRQTLVTEVHEHDARALYERATERR